MSKLICKGHEVLPYLANIYQQLYVKPDEDGPALYKKIVTQNEDAPSRDLSHFQMDEDDTLVCEETPAGDILIITLNKRADFEMINYIMANRCTRYDIPATQGAGILDGLINWTKINDHLREWTENEKRKGNEDPDENEEFARFTSDKNNYLDALIILSNGPYSNVSAETFDYSEQEWQKLSHSIRKYHECTHFVCRRLYKEKIDPIFDELVADSEGVYDTLGCYDRKMIETFLGINENGYTDGRLSNYVKEDQDINDLALKCHDVLLRIEKTVSALHPLKPFELAIYLEEHKDQFDL